MKYYLNLDFKTGRLYDYSKESQEGYEEHTSSTGNVSYRKYFLKGVYGTLKSVYVTDTNRGLHLKMILTQGEDYYVMLQFPMFDQKGNIDKFVESFIMLMPNIEIGADYRVFPFVLEPEGDRKYPVRGISVKHATLDGNGGGTVGERVDQALTYQSKDDKELAEDMIPRLEFKEVVKGSGKFAPTGISLAARKDFMMEVFNREIERLDPKDEQEAPKDEKEAPVEGVSTPGPELKTKKAPVAVELEEEDPDDVPF